MHTRLLLVLFLTFFIGVFPATAQEKDQSCKDLLPTAVKNLVNASFQNSYSSYTLKAHNDILCEDPENMANVVIVVHLKNGDSRYGIFHLHWRADGSLPFIPDSFSGDPDWTPMRHEGDWRREWCGFLVYVYPENTCEQNSDN